MGKYFGTDGIRGVANKALTPELAYKIGRAGAYLLSKETENATIIIGKDTRISGDMLETALIAGITSVGVNVLKIGVLPTPAVALLTRELKGVAGIVISASHNPFEDNGIKFFGSDGYKLPDEVEDQIEAYMFAKHEEIPYPTGGDIGRMRFVHDAGERYIKFLKSSIDFSLEGLKVVVDCANGAAYQVAPQVFTELGAEVIPLYHEPDGVNINLNCGSTHPEALQKKVAESGADIGIALDGDADRVIAVDEKGSLIDGDFIMVIYSLYLKERNELPLDTVAVTVMSNLGLHMALKTAGIKILETKVGDRYVLEELRKTGAIFGGEQSGHILNLKYNTTGDGVFTALQLLKVLKEKGLPLSELAAKMERFPQVLVNIRVTDKEEAMNHPKVKEAVQRGEEELQGKGRILVRASGTEPIVRVMVEGPNIGELDRIVEEIAAVIKTEAGE